MEFYLVKRRLLEVLAEIGYTVPEDRWGQSTYGALVYARHELDANRPANWLRSESRGECIKALRLVAELYFAQLRQQRAEEFQGCEVPR